MAFGGTTSGKLIDASDDFIDLSQDKAKFLIADHRHSGVPTLSRAKDILLRDRISAEKV